MLNALMRANRTVQPRDEVVRVDTKGGGVLGPGIADCLEGGSPSQRLEVPGEVVGSDKGQDMSLQRLKVGVVEGLGGGLLDGAVHPLCLTVGPGVVWPGEAVLDAMLVADAVEDAPEDGHDLRVATAVPGQVGKGHAVVGEHRVDLIREGLDHLTQSSRHCLGRRRPAAPLALVLVSKKAT